jgi:hypothetical protein
VAGFAAVEGIKALVGLWSKSMMPVRRDVDQLTDSLSRFATEGRVTGELAKVIGTDFESWGKHVADVQTAEFWAQLSHNGKQLQDLSRSFAQVTNDTKDMDTSLSNLVKNGDTQQAKAAFDEISKSLQAAGYSTDAINKLFPQYASAAGQASSANTPLALGFGDVSANASLMATGLQDAIDHGLTLADVFKQLNGAAEDSVRGEIDFEQSLADMTGKITAGKDALNDHTQAGRDNLNMVLSSIDAAQKAAEAKFNETNSVQQASDVYNGYIAELRKTLQQAGLTNAQIDSLINSYGRIPPSISTDITTSGVAAATAQANAYRAALDRIPASVQSTVYTKRLDKGRRWGGIDYAADGLIGLSQANTYRAGSQPIYGFAEPATGGEAFVPRFGDYNRSTSILDEASKWYGGRFVSGGGQFAGGGSGGPIALTVSMAGNGGTQAEQAMAAWFHDAVRSGQVQIFASQVRS